MLTETCLVLNSTCDSSSTQGNSQLPDWDTGSSRSAFSL